MATRSSSRNLLTIGALALTLAACGGGSATTSSAPTGATTRGGTPQSGGTLTIALSGIPASVDPYTSTLQNDWQAARNVCEPLFDVSASYQVKPVLADTVSYDQKLTYKITLRSGLSFHNGAPLTAEDAVASIQRFMLTPGNGAVLAANLASVKATGDLTLTITLKAPSVLVPTLLTNAFILPASVQKNRPITKPANDLICTGPYKLATFEPDRKIELVRYDGYQARTEPGDGGTGKKVAYADRIVMTPIPESSVQVQAVQSGEADITSSLPLDDYPTLSSSSTAAAVLLNASQSSSVVFNKTSGVMANVAMRQAFADAMDMAQVMGAGFGNKDFYLLDGSIIPKTNPAFYTTSGAERYNHPDLAKVKQLLQQAGYTGQKIVWLTTKADPIWYGPTEPAVQLLKKAGINVDLQVLDQASVLQRRSDPKQFDLFSSGYPTYTDPLLLPYLQDWFPGGWTDPAKNTLLTELTTESDPAARAALWAKLQALIYTDVPFLKFGTSRPLIGVSSRTHFTNADAMLSGYYNVWLDQSTGK